MCRGKHSKCGGKNPSKSVAWHLCVPCTALLKAAQKAAKAKPAKVAKATATPKSTGSSRAVVKAAKPAKTNVVPFVHGKAPRLEAIARQANHAPMQQAVAFTAPESAE